jgi:tetratricopeptide (TPR) repeat protein
VKATSKFLFSGCLLVIFIVLIIALIGTALALYSVFNGGSDKTQKASEPRIESISDEKNVEEYLELKKTMDADSTAEIDDEQICKMAFEKFQSAIKLSEEAEAKGDIALYEMALAEIEAALQLDTSNQAYWMLVGKLYSQMCPDLEIQLYAEHFLRKSLELAPLSADARLLLGNCLFQQKIYSEAIAEFEKALENEPRKLTEPLVPVIAAAYVYDSQYEKGENFLRVFSRGVRALMPSEYLWQL